MILQRSLFVLLMTVQVIGATAQTASQKAAVQLSATVQASTSTITLTWTSLPSTTSITIYRKLKSATSWGSAIASPSSTATTYADNTVSVGTAYEYKVLRVAGGVTGSGYISSGIQVGPVDYRGKMILLVDNTFSSALSTELSTLQNDLRADGWAVVRSDLARSASVATVRSTIVGHYNADAANVKTVFIIGHLAVPYSGNVNPDGHSEHRGAWPCDGYYGDVNGTWTDNSVNNSAASRPENRNIPGDGKFDQSSFPSPLELQVGRVDFYDMPAFSANETELTRAYLNKLHAFKMKFWAPTARGLVFDNLQWVSNPLAASAWRNIGGMVAPANVTAANQGGTLFHQLVDDQSYLWTYSSGGGLQATVGSTLTYNGADRVGTTQDFASTSNMGGVFNMSFGSYFGDWDNKNNFLRAPLASGYGLTNCWAAIPAWYFHHMAMGENIGYSTMVSMNNTSLYTPLTDGWQSTTGNTHLALMGDPSLRLKFLVPPSNLVVTNTAGTASFAWTPASEAVDGYHLYRVNSSTGALTRLTTNAVTGTTYSNGAIPYTASTEYMVRAVKLQTDPSGSYYNLSLGSFAITPAGGVADCQGVVGGSAAPGVACNDGNACTINDVWTSNCQCAGTAVNGTATITAGGPTSFCTGGSVVLSANTGTGYTYVWKKNGVTISGATSATYTCTTAGSYTVTRTSGGCATTSAATIVSVGTAPAATITAASTTSICSGASVVLNANTGTGYTYVWQKNGTTISGATSSNYAATTAGSYAVTVTNSGCSTNSAATAVTVLAAPTIACSANTAAGTVSVTATGGTTPYTYSWNTNPSQTTATASVSIAGSYTVTVRGANGCSTTCTVSFTPAGPVNCSGTHTEAQGSWGSSSSTQSLYMTANFVAGFPSPNYLTIGCGTRLMRFTTAASIISALPTYGTPALLPTGTTVNPTTVSNSFVGQLVSAKLNVRFDEMSTSFASSTVLLKNMIVASGTFAGMTVQQVINLADQTIGGCSSTYTRSSLSSALTQINNGYDGPNENSGYLVCPGTTGMVLEPNAPATVLDGKLLEVIVFPNPVRDAATILLTGGDEDEAVTIDLYTLSGAMDRSLYSGTVGAGMQQRIVWDASNCAPGVYFCRVQQGERMTMVKVLVQ
ncbi:MAG: T9SS type A sorting domain-containing protein [Flavobacteriales bacterium]|nr:T9SS type A sorting domain-containing protein [Flavobacteriales bacterium]